MTPCFASNFGNLHAFMLGVPTFAFTFVVGVVAIALRLRVISIVTGIACFVVAIWFLSSLDHAVETDRILTIVSSAIAGLTGLVFLLFRRRPMQRQQ